MAPLVESFAIPGTAEFNSMMGVVALLGVALSAVLVWLLCGGGKKKEDVEPPPPEPGQEKTAEASAKGAEASEKKNPTEGAAATAAGGNSKVAAAAAGGGSKVPEPQAKGPVDATQGPKGGGPELKRAAVPKGDLVSEDNPAYQTLLAESQFKASQKPGAKGAGGPKLDRVAGTNPAYQTILGVSEFKASKKPEGKAAQSVVGAVTAMAGPTEATAAGGTVLKTAVAAFSKK